MRLLAAIIAVAVLAGCQPAVPTEPGRFEVRDFKVEERKESYGVTTTGRGTLVSADESTKRGIYWILLEAKTARKNNDGVRVAVVLRDGIGTIETHSFTAPGEKGFELTGWEVIGVIRMTPGVIVPSGSVAAVK